MAKTIQWLIHMFQHINEKKLSSASDGSLSLSLKPPPKRNNTKHAEDAVF
jgi:hypothetical protein